MYVKLFGQILKSSLMDESIQTRWVWVVMLASADQDGMVYGTLPALARVANLPVDEFSAAMDRLMAPDLNSTTSDEDGRRVLLVAPNQWLLVNYGKYREMRDPAEERVKSAIRSKNYRDRHAASRPVTPRHTESLQAEAEAEAKADPNNLTVVSPADATKRRRTGKRIDPLTLNMDLWTWEGVTDTDRAGWSEAFPGIDLDLELSKAREWVKADAARRRKVLWRKFLVSVWFPRAQQSASRGGSPTMFPEARRQTAHERMIANLPDYGAKP